MTQYGVWVTNKNVPFQRLRYQNQTEMQEGVVDAGDYKVTAHAGNLSVDAAIGKAFIQIDTGTRNGLAFAFSDAVDNLVHAPADATNPRLDQIVLQYNDTVIPAGVGGDVPTTRIIQGVATAGATLDNRNGAAALPADCVRLADHLIPAGSTIASAANIRDRRPWARGARYTARVNGGASTAALAPGIAIDSTNGKRRLEVAANPVVATYVGMLRNSTAGADTGIALMVDAVQAYSLQDTAQATSPNIDFTAIFGFNGVNQNALAAGSHLFDWNVFAGSATASVQGACYVLLEEIVKQQADNGTT